MTKTNPGNFFEDFELGQVIEHATPRTVTEGDRALYGSLYPTRFALPSSAPFAGACGLREAPVEELIGFHIAFGKTVPDIRSARWRTSAMQNAVSTVRSARVTR
ncbi:MAG: hypothetical protein R2789_18910 [Microthrixaceae bacterium]